MALTKAMNATELQKENERLKRLLAESQAQHEAISAQFTATLVEKDRKVATLEHQIKLLLQRIKGSRQERINPDQLLLFSVEELTEIAEQLADGHDGDLIEDEPPRRGRRSRGRVGKLPEHLQREIIRHELSETELPCPCCGELRVEIGVESSEQLELVPARLKAIEHSELNTLVASVKNTSRSPISHRSRSKKGCRQPGCALRQC